MNTYSPTIIQKLQKDLWVPNRTADISKLLEFFDEHGFFYNHKTVEFFTEFYGLRLNHPAQSNQFLDWSIYPEEINYYGTFYEFWAYLKKPLTPIAYASFYDLYMDDRGVFYVYDQFKTEFYHYGNSPQAFLENVYCIKITTTYIVDLMTLDDIFTPMSSEEEVEVLRKQYIEYTKNHTDS